MSIKHVNLKEDSKCAFCGTEVKAGYSVCPNCGATHGYQTDEQAQGCLIVLLLIGSIMLNIYLAFELHIPFVLSAIIEVLIIIWIWVAYYQKKQKNLSWWR